MLGMPMCVLIMLTGTPSNSPAGNAAGEELSALHMLRRLTQVEVGTLARVDAMAMGQCSHVTCKPQPCTHA